MPDMKIELKQTVAMEPMFRGVLESCHMALFLCYMAHIGGGP